MAILKDYLENKSPLILHGALGTEMESLGYDISGKLWSAKYLLEKSDKTAPAIEIKRAIIGTPCLLIFTSFLLSIPSLAKDHSIRLDA